MITTKSRVEYLGWGKGLPLKNYFKKEFELHNNKDF